MTLLPDDIEQYLIDGQRQRAVDALMQRRAITYQAALLEIDRRFGEG